MGFGLVCGAASSAPADCGSDGIDFTGACVNLRLVPSASSVKVGDIFTVELFAKSGNIFEQPIQGIEAVLNWDPSLVELLGNEHDCAAGSTAEPNCFSCEQTAVGGPTGHNWVTSTFPNDPTLDRLNADCGPDTYCAVFTGLPFNDGNAWYQSIKQFFCNGGIAPAPAAPVVDPAKGSLLVTRFIFEALAPGSAQISLEPVGACLTRQKICLRGDVHSGEACETDSFCGVRNCFGGSNGAACVGGFCVGGSNAGGACPGGDFECPGDLCSSVADCPGGLCPVLCAGCSSQFCCTPGVDNCEVCAFTDTRVISGTSFAVAVTGTLGAPAEISILDCEPPSVVVDSSRYLNIIPPPGPDPVAIQVVGISSGVSCVSKFVQNNGTLGNNPIYKTPAEWQGAMTDAINDPTDPTVHARGDELVAGETYSVRLDCNAASPGTDVSSDVQVTLWLFGDTDNNLDRNITDVLKILSGFSGVFHTLSCVNDADCALVDPFFFCDQGACLWLTRENVDIIGIEACGSDRDISIRDALSSLNAFQGIADSCTIFCP